MAQLAGDMLRDMAVPGLRPVARSDVPEAMGAVMSGEVQMIFIEIPYALPYLENGALRGLATTGSARSPMLPALPTLAESGLKGYEFDHWFAAFVPAGTPLPVVDRIAEELGRSLDAPGMDRRLAAHGIRVPRR